MDFRRANNINRPINKTINNSAQAINPTGIIFWTFIYLVIGFIISYLTVMTVKYLSTKCLDKRSWIDYIFRFCYSDVCKTPEKQITTNVYYMPPQNGKGKPAKPHSGPSSPAVEYDINDLDEPKQVFHISNQDYTYEQAKCKCDSYNAKLATYGQIVEAHNKGAEWCSYGWSAGQTAYFPTQKCTWEKKSEDERRQCGKPGVNGGFFSDPYLRFGVNCYGRKPEGKVIKLKEPTCEKTAYCKLPENKFANNRLETDQIAPFNSEKWSV